MNVQRLKEIREDRDFKQREVASVLGMSQVVYSRYETRIRLIPIDKLDMLADFYGVSTDYLLGRTDEKKAYPKSILEEKKRH